MRSRPPTKVRPPIRSLAGVALAAAVGCASGRLARSHNVTDREERVFRWFNDRSDLLHAPAWLVMQSGSLGGVYLAAGGLAGLGRSRAALAAAVSGTAVWAGVKLVKPLVGRGRPEHHLADVNVRGQTQTGLGFPSGHAAVALTLAMAATSTTARPARIAAASLGGVVGATRMYVGAHLPLDVAGGLAIGALAGRATRAVLRMCRCCT